jgi:uncharacterized membrane protein
MKKKLSSLLSRLKNFIRSIFLNGLMTVAPLLLTIAIFNIVFKMIKSVLEPIRNLILNNPSIIPSWLSWIPHIELIVAILSILLLGTLLNIFVLHSILSWFETWFAKIPLIRPIYSGMKQLVKSFSAPENGTHQQVVLVQIPLGICTVGFVTGPVPEGLAPRNDIAYVSVYIPTTPNPTGGFYMMVAQDQLIPLNISRQEAMTLIMSVGMIVPKNK